MSSKHEVTEGDEIGEALDDVESVEVKPHSELTDEQRRNRLELIAFLGQQLGEDR